MVEDKSQLMPFSIPSALMAGVMCLVYLLFPTINPTGDAMGYATATEIGPHHLLYDQLLVWINYFCGFSPQKTLVAMNIINAICAGLVLLFFQIILGKLRINWVIWWAFVCGSTFGFMRFATENEAYIIPLLFALLGLLFFIIYFENGKLKWILLAYCFLVLSILFHQSYIFWFVGCTAIFLLKKSPPIRHKLAPVMAAFIVTLVYSIYASLNNAELLQWIFKDAHEGLVDLSPGLDNFLFTGLGFMRTFFQIHGNIQIIVNHFPWLYIIMGCSIVLLVFGIILLFKNTKIKSNYWMKPIIHMGIMVFLLHLIFAWYSVGNSEFMVMFPFLISLVLGSKLSIDRNTLIAIGGSLFLWNLSVGIIPSAKLDYYNRVALFHIIYKLPNGMFIAHNRVETENHAALFLDTGSRIRCNNINKINKIRLEISPADANDIDAYGKLIDKALQENLNVYTNCIVHPTPKSRHSMIGGDINLQFFKQYHVKAVDSFHGFYGKTIIHKVMLKH